MKRQQCNKMLLCTACPNKSDAEVIHPQLKVPICGACSSALKDADIAMIGNQIQSCTWCGNADFVHLFMCDTCPRSFCEDCLTRNFGVAEAEFVKQLDVWSCYICTPTTKLKALQVQEDIKYFNIDRAYNSIRPPSVSEVSSQSAAALAKMTPQERNFAAIFAGGIGNVTIQDGELIGQYLTAVDFAVVLRVSKGLRAYFQSEVSIIPGLFKTEYGAENNCRLYNHQVVSLNRMTQIENASKEFGALRGGIFGDEPGLGKTVTTLALVASTAGLMPQLPSVFWDKSTIDEHWKLQKGQYGALLGVALNALQKSPAMGRYELDRLHQIRINVEKYCETVETFESAVRKCIREEIHSHEDRSKLLDLFRQEMNRVKEGLDRNLRKHKSATANTPKLRRIRYERSLCPSSATLIVVPLALLEHWYEQITRHLNLNYFSQDNGRRGIVYLDGLGDIMDVQAPLSKVKAENSAMESVQFLSHYMIVVTTFERCAAEFRNRQERGNQQTVSASGISLLQMRWLRLVVDEGHEIGKSSTDLTASRVTKFISQIAAERRWVMSGTPTTGAQSAVALEQLYRLLQFIRHPRIVHQEAPVVTTGASGNNVCGNSGSSSRHNSSSSLVKMENDTTSSTTSTTTLTKRKSATNLEQPPEVEGDFLSIDKWHKDVIAPCLAQKESAWQAVMDLLKTVLLRHTKSDIHLFEPIRVSVNLEHLIPLEELAGYTEDERAVAFDRCKANYIADTMIRAKQEYRAYLRNGNMHTSEARRRSIMNRINHNRMNTSSTSSAAAIPTTPTPTPTPTATANSAGSNDRAVKSVNTISLAQLLAVKKKNSSAAASVGAAAPTGALTGPPTALGSPIKCTATAGNGSSSSSNSAEVDTHISRMLEVTEAEKDLCSRVRLPKAIVFSQNEWDLQGVGHQLILRLGGGAICEHFGNYRSSELSRFRHSKRKFRPCPLCGYCNQITTGNSCSNPLLLVEYTNINGWTGGEDNNNPQGFEAHPGGHGKAGPGGHYTGKCLCSPEGCVPPAGIADPANWFCGHYPNPFFKVDLVSPTDRNYALVSYEHIDGYIPGKLFHTGDHVFVRRQDPCPAGTTAAPTVPTAAQNPIQEYRSSLPPTNSYLWQSGGVLGGHAIVRGWRNCGGKNDISWHGNKILQNVAWKVEEEEANILLLKEDGSTGLDLSFATHIFLLDRIKDPALRNQIVSRAHRMGATGPVRVELVQVKTDGESEE